jgi:pyruvate/2-oxoglutarate/acetoin dehydrogenase E1 component
MATITQSSAKTWTLVVTAEEAAALADITTLGWVSLQQAIQGWLDAMIVNLRNHDLTPVKQAWNTTTVNQRQRVKAIIAETPS